ncbi:MAG: NEW3 domain-containing protein, partial [Hungatella sp.]
TLINNGAADQSYSLSAEAPQGWQVSFKPSGSTTQVASVEVASAASQGLSVTVIPSADVEAGEYTIPISAIAAGESLKSELKVHITGTYALDVSTPMGRLSFDAQAKETQKQTLTITNNSNVPLENINLSASAPTDWTVEFDTPTIEVLETGETKEVIASIIPGEKAMTGDYVTAITTSATEVSDTAEFRVTVKTDTLWGLAAVAVIAGVVLWLGYVFRKYGRR